jgi:DNA-directed RNA polymerase subunit RPC12/RpoP
MGSCLGLPPIWAIASSTRYLHRAPDRQPTRGLSESAAICVDYESVEDEWRLLPPLAPMSEVASKVATQAGASFSAGLGFKQRERKRKAKAAQEFAQRSARRSGVSAASCWLTLAREKAACARCGRLIQVGGDLVYRHEPRELRCMDCGVRLEDSKGYRTSLRWSRERSRKRSTPD